MVGTERLQESGYFRAKQVQENLIKASPMPYTIVHSTQFFEFAGAIADSAVSEQTVRLPIALMQPIASADVSAVVADVALAQPLGGVVEVAGPEPLWMEEFVRRYLDARGDGRTIVVDTSARYYGATLQERSLMPGANSHVGSTRYDEWLRRSALE